MKKIEVHTKTKYSYDKDSTIDIESIIWNAKENKEKGIIFVDKDSIVAFPKIEQIYNKLCTKDKTFKNFKVGYGVQLTSIIEDKEYEVVALIKNNKGLWDIYKIMSLYLNEYERKIPISKLTNKDNLLLGLMLNEESIKLDLSIFDYLEINSDIDISSIKDKSKIVYSNVPNALFEGELLAKKVLYHQNHIDKIPECRLYKDTEDTLKEYNNKEIVIANSNMLFDNLDSIVINDGKFHTTHIDNFDEFESLVRSGFERKFSNPDKKTITRLNEELNLIKELDYTYYYELLMIITNYCNEHNEYYQLDGYINNSLVAYVLNLTEIEPFNLPYELFFSEIPKLEIKISSKFYYKKLFPYIITKFKDKLIRCSYGFKLSKTNIPRLINHYEIKTKKKLSSTEKDYIVDILNDIPLYKKDCINNSFYLIPDNSDVFNFSPYELYDNNDSFSYRFMGTHYDYHDLENNLIKLQFILNDDIEDITHLINKTNSKVDLCNDKKVYNLFRNTEEFKCKFNILNKSTGTLNIRYFDDLEIENRLPDISNIWLDDLASILMNINHGIIKDDLYNDLKLRGLDEKDIFNVINSLKDSKILLVSKAFILNKIRISYMQMYYKLYFPKEYYEVLLSNIMYQYINDKVYKYDINVIKNRYYELSESNKLCLSLEEREELNLLQVLIEMYERNIKYKIKKGRVIL